jgi:protein JSN1
MAMLERIAPHLALIGTHKNGTWAAQKIIECAETPQELATIAQNLQPYCPPLCADQVSGALQLPDMKY